MVTSIHSMQKRLEIARNLESRWKLLEDSRLKRERNQLAKKPDRKENDIQKSKVIDKWCESKNTVFEKHISPENTFWYYVVNN